MVILRGVYPDGFMPPEKAIVGIPCMLEVMISCPAVPMGPVFVMVIVAPSLVAEIVWSDSEAPPLMAVVKTVAK